MISFLKNCFYCTSTAQGFSLVESLYLVLRQVLISPDFALAQCVWNPQCLYENSKDVNCTLYRALQLEEALRK